MKLSISSISLPEDPDRVLSLSLIETIVVRILLRETIEPIDVRERADGHYDLCDGRHRFVGHVVAGRAIIDVRVLPALEHRS